MLYIHKLHQLNPKSAEVESVYLVRELRSKAKLPLTENHLEENLSVFFVSDTDKEKMNAALGLIQPTIEIIQNLLQQRDPVHETINLQRAVSILGQLVPHIHNNILYAEEITFWQSQLVPAATAVLNKIPRLRTKEEKKMVDQQLQALFQTLLRNTDFRFQANDIISEGELTVISDLCESMEKGFFFHIPLEEEIKKRDFSEIKKRIPADKTAVVNSVQQNFLEIKKGVERAYEMNMRQVMLGVHLYSYVRWSNEKL